MTMTLGELQGEVYEILQKSPKAPGLLTPNKVTAAIRDSLDYIATRMIKIGGGWLGKIVYLNVQANNPYVPLPAGLAIINFVKFMPYGSSTYVPIDFDENSSGVSDTSSSGVQGVLPIFRFSSGQIYMEPTITTALPNAIMIDGVFYPSAVRSEGDVISGDMDNRALLHYAKWRAASQLRTLTTKDPPPWAKSEEEWRQAAIELIARRIRMPTSIKSFPMY